MNMGMPVRGPWIVNRRRDLAPRQHVAISVSGVVAGVFIIVASLAGQLDYGIWPNFALGVLLAGSNLIALLRLRVGTAARLNALFAVVLASGLVVLCVRQLPSGDEAAWYDYAPSAIWALAAVLSLLSGLALLAVADERITFRRRLR